MNPLVPIFILLLIIIVAVKLLRSPKFDKWCKEMSSGTLADKPKVKEKMKEITNAKKDLGKQSDDYVKEAEKLTNESENINDFLDRGKDKTGKGEES